MDWSRLLEPEIFVFLVPIAAIVVGGAIAIAKLVIHHRERLAMIEHGIHPDHPPEDPGGLPEDDDSDEVS